MSVDLYKPEFAQQIINYGYSKTVKWVVLSDFEGTKVFNSLVKTKRLSEKTILDLKYTEYLDKFDELWLLGKESIVNGKLNEYAKHKGHVVHRIPINELLLEKLLKWRDKLERRILGDNPRLSKEESQECVQKLLNRFIFIRTCEDRKIDKENLLKNAFKEWENVSGKSLSKMLNDIFRDFDEGYNSNLFAEHEIEKLKIDDDILAEVINGLYEDEKEDVSFDFSVIDADMLGSIYEQYLGTIQRSGGSKAKRKSQGIYYTPKYIVDYIVENTLGRVLADLLKEKKYKQIGKIKVLDPACGSGSFLLKTLKVFDDAYSKSPEHNQFPFMRKVKALSNNLYGVDLDEEAIELTKLNLLMNIVSARKKLPDLSHNIECGNSLIDDPDVAGDKAFNWETRFKDVMDKGGFDVVIGNPPYVQLSMEGNISQPIKDYLIRRYLSSMGRLNTFGFFIKLGIDLLNDGGYLSFIIPNTILTQDYYEELRKLILDSCAIESIVSFDELPFKEAVVENVILVLHKESAKSKRAANKVQIFGVNEQGQIVKKKSIAQGSFETAHKLSFNLNLVAGSMSLKNKIEAGTKPLGDFLEINQAIALKHDRAKYLSDKQLNKTYKPVLDGRNINRYSLVWHNEFLKYDIDAIHSCKREDIFLSKNKLFFRRVGDRLIATYDDGQFYALNTLVVMNLKGKQSYNLKYYLALFNSRLINYYYESFLKSTKKVFSEIQARQVAQLPIKTISFDNSNEKNVHNNIVKLVDKMLDLNKQYAKVKDKQTSETERLKRRIEETDREIDQMVYKLYGLTKEEIKIIEGGT
ncbi:MAG: N-6 DNA methylase [Candidatus Saganbacteria bacterium]|nr:N-6 DNA methylase [Candidatus Saganbacteria bacterium]